MSTSNHPRNISVSDFTYELPQEKIAVYPLEDRDASKLLVFKGGVITESRFRDVASFLKPGSLVFLNNTQVIQARLKFETNEGKAVEIFCLEPSVLGGDISQLMQAKEQTNWNCMVGNLKRWKQTQLTAKKNDVRLNAVLLQREATYVQVEFSWSPANLTFAEILEQFGAMPIPPYLNRESAESDTGRYQTVYARHKGSVAAPTAGLHFTAQVFQALKERSITTIPLTLHVGAGTFKPVKSSTMEGHEMHAEWFDVELKALEILQNKGDNPVISVGTTTLRTLESLYWMGVKLLLRPKTKSVEELTVSQWEVYDLPDHYSVEESFGALIKWMRTRKMLRLLARTSILIAPPYQLKVASGLITNFHQPASTLLLLVATVAGKKWKDIYDYALSHNFRFLSYGDSSLLLK